MSSGAWGFQPTRGPRWLFFPRALLCFRAQRSARKKGANGREKRKASVYALKSGGKQSGLVTVSTSNRKRRYRDTRGQNK
uniref:Uncharacterized protein n=1 Tax=Chromera velia CCMP2878 TaxID=1169474 RepID=A0A0G4HGX9_9ALVE|eukprot:Cvel_27437.t1-p1 / transcript=Cvel_27437.t1 / gene=Cvel_27437 / organism=Chromera_velia_CCMP2878 / gene_product=hypothetical protein / transcript_product=hypothetical protein / location=Cvel_scaffold3423:1199-2658(+) / protein_length=79 / sequence_SO=supercontig / SO=protein_coding / is_pseudo=false